MLEMEIMASAFLAVMAYYDLFEEENIPSIIVHLFFLISWAIFVFALLPIINALVAIALIAVFYAFFRLNQCGEAEIWIFPSLALLFGWWVVLIAVVAYMAFFLKHIGEMKFNKEAFIPFILIALVSLILNGVRFYK